MIILCAGAAIALVYRLATRQFRRVEAVLLAVMVIGFLIVWAQIWVADGKPFPERRYWLQFFVLLFAWTAWGACHLSDVLARRVPAARFVLPAIVIGFIVIDVVTLFKPMIPVGRQHIHVKVCNWAAEAIRADWKGPQRDENVSFSIRDYHPNARPIVEMSRNLWRVGYLVGGRYARISVFGQEDAPDYVLEEKGHELSTPSTGAYELMVERSFGKRHFALYRRKTGGGQ